MIISIMKYQNFEYIQIMLNLLRLLLRRSSGKLAPYPQVCEPLDHPEIQHMGKRELDDLPLPRLSGDGASSDCRA